MHFLKISQIQFGSSTDPSDQTALRVSTGAEGIHSPRPYPDPGSGSTEDCRYDLSPIGGIAGIPRLVSQIGDLKARITRITMDWDPRIGIKGLELKGGI